MYNDSSTTFASRIACISSICVIISCSTFYATTVCEIETLSEDYEQIVESFQEISHSTYNGVQSQHIRRASRNVHYTRPEQSFLASRTDRGDNNFVALPKRRPSYYEPKICDCTNIRCPRGPRGPPGPSGTSAEDGQPGNHGHPGIDGLFLGEAIVCPTCSPGPPGDDGLKGKQGDQGRPGKPGLPGSDGTSEPGATGDPGNTGQTGRPGKKGAPGEPGEDAVQLIGVRGPRGRRGAPGISGARGDPGLNGFPAPPGLEGPPGIIGDPGDCGDYGFRGNVGRTGPPGEDGGYCQCPPRDGSPVKTGDGEQILLFERYHYKPRTRDGSSLQVRSNDEREHRPYRRQKAIEEYKEYSSNIPTIEYKDAREASAHKRVPLHGNQEKKAGEAIDVVEFELRASL